MRKAMEFESDAVVSEGNTGEHSESLKTLDENAITDKNLINTVEGRMEFLKSVANSNSAEFEEVDDTPIPDVPEDESEEEIGQEAVPDTEDDSTPNKEVEKDSKDDTVVIPEAYVRAAIHHGWSKDDVDALIKVNPELALKTFTSCHNSVTNSAKEWSALGRAKIQSEREVQQDNTIRDSDDQDLKPLLEKLKESYGDDPLVASVSKLLSNMSKVSKPAVKQTADSVSTYYQTATAQANAAARAATDQRVNSFFSNDAMKPYEEFYGKLGLSQSVSDLTNGQQEHRYAVLSEAECILTGLRMQGLDVPVEQVLEKAHLIVTEPIREQVIVNNLKKNALDRKKTLRPAKSKTVKSASTQHPDAKPKDRNELIRKVEQKLANLSGLRN